MMQFRSILHFPAFYAKRQKSVSEVIFKSVESKWENDKLLISSKTDKYSQNLQFQEIPLNKNTPIKISCTCQSFQFEFAYAVNKQDSLFNSDEFEKSIDKRPKEKNSYLHTTGCKHLIALANYIVKHPKTLERKN